MDRLTTPEPPVPPVSPEATAQNLRRLLQLRWIAIGGQTLTIGIVHFALGLSLPIGPLAAVVATLALWNIVSWRRARTRKAVGNGELILQILVDVGAFSCLLYFTGGSTNPFVSLYLLPLFIAATLLPPAVTWGFAGLTALCYTLLLSWYVPLRFDHETGTAFSLHVFGMWLNFVLSAALVAWFVVRMAASVRDRDWRLAEANERALQDEKVVALGTFAAGAAHDLGTPLATIAVLARELETDCHQPTRHKDLRLLRAQVDECKRIISDLLSTAGCARAEDARPQPADAFLQGIVDQWHALRPGAQLCLRLGGATPVPLITSEKTLAQAFMNLLNNAFDASPSGIELDGGWSGEEMTLEIRDRGNGIDPATAQRVGELFFTTKAASDGRGLGVFLARAAIQRLGGRLDLANREGGGAAIRVVLPLSALRTERSE